MTSKIEISHRTIIFTVAFLASIWLILQIRDIIYLLFVSFIVMTALQPVVDGLERLKIPRFLSILLVYCLILGFLGVAIATSIPSFVSETTKLIQLFPTLVERLLPYWNIDVRSVTQQLAPIGENIVKVSLGIFSNIVTLLTVLIFTFYFLLERKNVSHHLKGMLGGEAGEKIIVVLRAIEGRMGAWVRGQLTLMVIIGVVVYLGLTFLRVEFALPLAILAGALEIVPMIGPLVSATIAVLVALTVSPLLAAVVAAMYFIIQQCENAFIVPQVLSRSVGLSPIITIPALLIGGRLAGVLGAMLAVPIVVVIQTILNIFFLEKSEEKIAAFAKKEHRTN